MKQLLKYKVIEQTQLIQQTIKGLDSYLVAQKKIILRFIGNNPLIKLIEESQIFLNNAIFPTSFFFFIYTVITY